jgi:UDP-N-acetylmuramoyl-tripeptide--D-alanyl-D-alanine ligase
VLLAEKAGAERIISFGKHPDADARLEDASLGPAGSAVRARIDGRPMSYAVGVAGMHMVINSLAVLAAALFVGADLDSAAAALASFTPGQGRGTRIPLKLASGSALLIDESYNANPASMRAAIGVLARIEPAGEGRRIAVLGDMLELGKSEYPLHAALAEPLEAAGIDRIHLVGERMAALWEVLPPDRRGVYAETADGLAAALADELRPGDVVMVKGSNGIRLGAMVDMLRQQFGGAAQARQGAR